MCIYKTLKGRQIANSYSNCHRSLLPVNFQGIEAKDSANIDDQNSCGFKVIQLLMKPAFPQLSISLAEEIAMAVNAVTAVVGITTYLAAWRMAGCDVGGVG